jgi:hypothetical protein
MSIIKIREKSAGNINGRKIVKSKHNMFRLAPNSSLNYYNNYVAGHGQISSNVNSKTEL